MKKNNIVRVGVRFNKEIEKIKQERLRLGMDKKKKSTRKLSNLLVRHNLFPEIRRSLIELDENTMESKAEDDE